MPAPSRSKVAVEDAADGLAAGEVAEVAGVVVRDQQAAPLGGLASSRSRYASAAGESTVRVAAGGPVVEVGVEGGEPLERGVVDGGDRRVVAALADQALHRRVDDAEPQQVGGVAGLVDPPAEQLAHEGRPLRRLVLGQRPLAHRGGQAGARNARTLTRAAR